MTDIITVPEQIVTLEATIEEPFVEDLNNRFSQIYLEYEAQLVTVCDLIFFQAFGSIFNRTNVIEFRPRMENTQVIVELVFNNSAPVEKIPDDDKVVETLVEAVKNNSFELPLDPDSIAVISPNSLTTTQGPTSSLALTTTALGSIPATTEQMTDSITVSEQIVTLEATIEEPFVEDLNNRFSQIYLEYEAQLVTVCDLIFFQAFGSIFNRTIVIEFRPLMENTQVVVELVFNNSAPVEKIPGDDEVVKTLVEAVKSSNNTFDLPLDPDSIAVISPNSLTTTQGPTSSLALSTTALGSIPATTEQTTDSITVPEQIVTLEATIEEPFVEDLNNRFSQIYLEYEAQLVTVCDLIFFQAFGSIFNRTIVIEFRPLMENTQVVVELVFNNSAPVEKIPDEDEVVETLVEAVKNNSFELPLDPDSIAVISPNSLTTTPGPTSSLALTATALGSIPATTEQTTDSITVPEQIVTLEATIEEPFVEDLNNRFSQIYLEYEAQLVTVCDFIFFQAFGSIFNRTIVIEFRPLMENTQVVVELVFNNSAPVEKIPDDDEVVKTLVEAVKSSNNTFDLPLDPDSIAVISPNSLTTTQGPTSSLALSTTALGSIPATTEQTTDSITVPEQIVTLEATIEEPFVEDLNNRFSQIYLEYEAQLVTVCDFIFFQAFGSIFNRTIVIEFRPLMENTQVVVELVFNNSAPVEKIPDDDKVVETLVEAVKNNSFELPLDPDSIAVISPNSSTTTQGPTSSLALSTTALGSIPATTEQTTDSITVPEQIVTLEATIEEPFVEDLNNRFSQIYLEYEAQLVTVCDFIFLQAFGSIFNRTIVIEFRPLMENTQVVVELVFNNSAPVEKIPDEDEVVETLVEAVKNNSFELPLDPDSIAVISSETTRGPTSATTQQTTDIISVSSPVVLLEATLVEPFVKELNNRSSEQYIELENQVVSMCDLILLQEFGTIFIRTIVTGFSPKEGNTRVELDLEFNSSIPSDQIPEADVVVETLVQAVNIPNDNFPLKIDPDSIAVISSETTTRGPSSSHVPATVVPNTAHISTSKGQTTTHVLETNEPTTSQVLATNGPTTTPIPETTRPTSTHIPATNGPASSHVPTTKGPTTTHVTATDGPTTSQISATNKPSTSLVTATKGPTTIHVVATEEQTTTHIPATNGPTTTHVVETEGPTTTHIPATNGPTSSHVPTTKGPTTTHVTATDGPTTSQISATNKPSTSLVTATKGPTTIHVVATEEQTTTHIPATNGPTTTHVVATEEQTTTHIPATNGPTTTRVAATDGPTTTHIPATNGPTTTRVAATDGPTTSQISATNKPSTSLVTATKVPTTTHVVATEEQTTTHIPATNGPTTTHVAATEGPTTTHIPATNGPTTTRVAATDGPTTTHIPATNGPTTTRVAATDGPTTSQISATNKPSTSLVTATKVPTTTHVVATEEQTTTHIPATNGPTTTHVVATEEQTTTHIPATNGPTTTHVAATEGPTTTHIPATNGPTTTHVAATDGPTTSQIFATNKPSTSHVTATSGPTTTHVVATEEQTTTHIPATNGPTTTHVAATEGPTTTHIPATNGPTTTHVAATDGPTTSQIFATNKPSTSHITATKGPTTTHVVATNRPTTSHVPATIGQTTTHVPATEGLTTTHIPATNGPTTSNVPATKGPTTTHVSATEGPITTLAPATPNPTVPKTTTLSEVITSPPAVVTLTATLEEPFLEAYNDASSAEYRALETQVVTACDAIYRQRFFLTFIRTFVIRIVRAVVVTRMDNTRVDVGLEFKNISSTPEDEVVVNTLEETLAQPNNTFNISIVANTVQVIESPQSAQATTASNTNSPAANTVALVTRTLTFTSIGETFTSDLLNQSSAAFIDRAGRIKTILGQLFTITFSAFRDLTVTSFSNGSIINNMDLRFTSDNVPANSVIASVLINAAPNITAFNVNTSSIFVDGVEFSSGTSHKTSLVTASGVVLLSWLLSSLL
ncbi:mucin-2-like isoform X3 [Corythoichthys intestinalis]|uniref:mucin-2-like isoform X3 n=1 Tax=Corythoichthys intestinalis TaxID=161448 RepID=UPI0025A5B993|nr:mucin-2-like isoform X3 [Corythoichthys intestinalis]